MSTLNTTKQPYDVTIIGAGASGAALLYTLATYTNIENIALVEKYSKPGQVNSKATNNSQTLHVGDIETNYSLEKVKDVHPASMMVAHYAHMLPETERNIFLFPTTKMVLAVGAHEVAILEKRYADLKPLFPDLQKLDRAGIASVEPAVVQGRDASVPLLALYTTTGYAVDFEKLAMSLINNAVKNNTNIDTLFEHNVVKIVKNKTGYKLIMKDGTNIETKILVVDADSYSLLLAQQLGYGKEFSLIPIAGSFYFSKQVLNGKVYTVQEPKLPFAAVHGDPDVNVPGQTRWGPTARFHPVLEARNFSTMKDFFKSSGLARGKTWLSFFKILLDPIRFKYLLENMLYELPYIGTRMFIKNVRKIVPTITAHDVTMAKGYGGMRLQRVNTNTKEMLLGEGKIIGDNAIFNMTPSPGASVCLFNAMRDAETIVGFMGELTHFDSINMRKDLYMKEVISTDISIQHSYVS